MRLSRTIRWLIATLAILVSASLGYYYFILEWHDKPFCHRQVMLSLHLWIARGGKDLATRDNPFPNTGGIGRDSLASIHAEMGEHMEWMQDYGYVPGLRQDDPG